MLSVVLHFRENSLLKVGLTGGIASGKSAVGEMLGALGARLIQADQIAHELMQPGHAVYGEVVRRFGKAILNPDGTINRPKLAEAAFNPDSSGATRVVELNRIVHPAVIRRENEWMEAEGRRDPRTIAVVEAALILEAGAAERLDRLIVVTCSEEQRVARYAQRLNIDVETARREVERRMAAQLPDSVKIQRADYVVDNSGSLDNTEAQVRELYATLKQEAEQTQLREPKT
jgi:dephospho-CoA kinase